MGRSKNKLKDAQLPDQRKQKITEIHKQGRGNLSLKFYSSSSTPETLRRETEKREIALRDLGIKNSSNKCDIPWVGGGSGV